MGTAYVGNTIQLLEAITDDSKDKHNPQPDKKCYKCFYVPNYIFGEYCDVKSPKNKPKSRKLIRNTNTTKHINITSELNTSTTTNNDNKSNHLPIPAPIMIEESYCSDVSSLDLGIATVELPSSNPSIGNGNNSSYSTVDMNNSFEYDHQSMNSTDSIENGYKMDIQNDIIQRNSLHKYLFQMTESDNDESYDFSDRDKSNFDNLTDIITSIEPYHMEGVESETELVMNLGIELKNQNKPQVYLQKRRKKKSKRKKKRKKKKRHSKKVNPTPRY